MAAIATPDESRPQPPASQASVDLIAIGFEPHCVVASRGRDRNKDNHSITRCGRKLLVTTPGRDIILNTTIEAQVNAGRQLCTKCVSAEGADTEPDAPPAAEPDDVQKNTSAPATKPIHFAYIRVDQIRKSPLNHRTIFNGIKELGADILAHGCKVPVKVRPVVDSKDPEIRWELVYGERRWRGAKSAGVEELPALIQELTDAEVVDEQLVENVTRADIHPLEEADCYQAMTETHGYTVEQLVRKTGKSETAIRNRMKLLSLPKSARDAFLSGKIVVSVAELIARIPVAKLRDQATSRILQGRQEDFYNLTDSQVGTEDSAAPPVEGVEVMQEEVVPLSVREAQVLIQRHYMLRLELAPFDPGDETLTKVGACTKCVHRSGNQPDLFNDVPSTDVCTNPPCFDEKKKADWDARAEKAKEEGKRILTPTEADTVFNGDRLEYNAPYIDLKADADWDFQPKGSRTREKTWAEVLGKHTPTIVLARDGGGAAHQLVDKREAMESLKEAGKLPKARVEAERSAAGSGSTDKRAREKRDLERRTAEAAIAELAADNFSGYKPTLWIAECVIRIGSQEAHQATCRRREIEPKKGAKFTGPRKGYELALLDYARDLVEVEELNGLIRELLASEPTQFGAKGWGENLVSAAKVFGFDLGKIQKRIEGELKAKKADKPKPSKASKPAAKKSKPPKEATHAITDDGKRCGLVYGKNGACIHELGHDGLHSNGIQTWRDRPAKKGGK